jgi:anti-anti-sigma factor
MVARHFLEEEYFGDIAVVKFRQTKLLEEATIVVIGEQLLHLANDPARRHLVLNLESVERLSTSMVGTFIALHNKLASAGGQLVLCGIDRELYEMLAICRLTHFCAFVRGRRMLCRRSEPLDRGRLTGTRHHRRFGVLP